MFCKLAVSIVCEDLRVVAPSRWVEWLKSSTLFVACKADLGKQPNFLKMGARQKADLTMVGLETL